MNSRRLLIVALSATMMFGACGDNDDGGTAPVIATGGGGGSAGGTAGGGGTGTGGGNATSDGGVGADGGVGDGGVVSDGGVGDAGTTIVLTEAEAAAVLSSVNAGELQVAQAVMQRLTDTEARAFAEQMISEHSAVQREATRLLTQRGLSVEPNPISQALDQATAELIAMLSSMSGRELDAAYLQSQLTMHQQALSLIDCLLAPAVRDPVLRGFVTQRVRPAVAEHLETAAALAASLGGIEPTAPVDTGPTQCDLTCIPQGAGGPLPDPLRIVACPQ